jgi:hypothetical protein
MSRSEIFNLEYEIEPRGEAKSSRSSSARLAMRAERRISEEGYRQGVDEERTDAALPGSGLTAAAISG